MRMILVIGFAALAAWRAWIDWRMTIAEGYAYRLSSVDEVLIANFPQTHESVTSGLEAMGVPWLWDPIAVFLLAMPLAIIPAVIALLLWITRPRGRGRG